MTSLHRLVYSVLAGVLLVIGAWFGVRHYGASQHRAGYEAAIADGKEARDAAALANLAIESGLRARLLAQDAAALRKEQEHADSLQTAQRRMRAGDDRLRCPAGPVPATPAPGDRPAAGRTAVDGEGPAVVPEVAAEILGDAADVAGLVRRYARVVERFEACRAVNEK